MATKIDPGALELHRSQSWTINSDIEETTKPKQQEKKNRNFWPCVAVCLTRALLCISKNISIWVSSHKPQAHYCANKNNYWTVSLNIYQMHGKKVILLWKERLEEVTDGDEINKLHTGKKKNP